MEDNNDDVDRDKDPPDTFSEYSDLESVGGGFPIGTLATMKYRRYGKGEGEETALIERRHGLGGSVDVLHLRGVQSCMDFECI
ncbi:hypothetical protein HO133_006610 [Letharia lupina]|uniref:Uncharacterized protein n=1 Tax=Letharia lupina TaxID=560253 RepID=A0A8H6C6D1_9LECA|nr:uncharacterized protein HO133_006610 [Letharia lupina]KAF6217783.1 hypothetical protein HO133_006610 [Letharia lupina]